MFTIDKLPATVKKKCGEKHVSPPTNGGPVPYPFPAPLAFSSFIA